VNHSVNLPALLEDIKAEKILTEVTLDDGLRVKVRPLTYKDMTQTSLQTFQQQKMYTAVSDSQMADEEKTTRFNEAFKKLTELNSNVLLKNMQSIVMPDGTEVTDPAQIKEFFDKANAKIIKEIETKMIELRSQGAVKPLKLKATEEQIKKGAPTNYEIPVSFDNANFFV